VCLRDGMCLIIASCMLVVCMSVLWLADGNGGESTLDGFLVSKINCLAATCT